MRTLGTGFVIKGDSNFIMFCFVVFMHVLCKVESKHHSCSTQNGMVRVLLTLTGGIIASRIDR